MEKTNDAKCEMLVNLPTLGAVKFKIINKYRNVVKKICFCYKLDPKHDPFFWNNFKHCKLYFRVHTRIAHTCTNRLDLYTSVHTAFLINVNTAKIHIKLFKIFKT